MKLREAINDIKTGVVHPVYFLKGNDHFLQNFFIDELAKNLFEDQNENRMLMLPDEMSGKEIIDQLTTIDLFSEKKLFILRDPQKLKGKASLDLIALCKDSINNHFIVLISDDWIQKTVLFKKIETFINPIDVQTPFTNDMKKWANYLVKKRGKTALGKVQQIMVDMAGDSVAHLDNEIEKICLLIGGRNNIEAEDVEQFSGWKRDRQRWEFLTALAEKDYSKSIKLGKSIVAKHESMISLIYPLTTLFQEMLFFKMKKGTFKGHHGYTPIPPSLQKRMPQFSKQFTIEKLESTLKMLGNIDKRQKTAYSLDETELIQFIGHAIG